MQTYVSTKTMMTFPIIRQATWWRTCSNPITAHFRYYKRTAEWKNSYLHNFLFLKFLLSCSHKTYLIIHLDLIFFYSLQVLCNIPPTLGGTWLRCLGTIYKFAENIVQGPCLSTGLEPDFCRLPHQIHEVESEFLLKWCRKMSHLVNDFNPGGISDDSFGLS